MPADNYQTIFELGFRSFPWARMIQPLAFLIIGLMFIRLHNNRKVFIVVGVFVASMASLILLTSLVIFVPDFFKLRSAYVSGKSAIVQGVIKDFHRAPTTGPATESFLVNGVNFSYNALDATPCFHNKPFHHGPIREGLEIRIHYFGGCIQRIDVLNEPASRP